MDARGCKPAGSCEPERSQDYKPPRVERVLTPAELQREILCLKLLNELGLVLVRANEPHIIGQREVKLL